METVYQPEGSGYIENDDPLVSNMFLIVNLQNGRRIPTTKHIRGLKAPALILDDCFEDLEFPNARVLGILRTGENSAVSASDLFLIPEF